jgi:hypothetical protein
MNASNLVVAKLDEVGCRQRTAGRPTGGRGADAVSNPFRHDGVGALVPSPRLIDGSALMSTSAALFGGDEIDMSLVAAHTSRAERFGVIDEPLRRPTRSRACGAAISEDDERRDVEIDGLVRAASYWTGPSPSSGKNRLGALSALWVQTCGGQISTIQVLG